MSSYTFKLLLKEHPIRSSRGVYIQTPHPMFNSVNSKSYPTKQLTARIKYLPFVTRYTKKRLKNYHHSEYWSLFHKSIRRCYIFANHSIKLVLNLRTPSHTQLHVCKITFIYFSWDATALSNNTKTIYRESLHYQIIFHSCWRTSTKYSENSILKKSY